jgi:hypothetical protein
LPPSLIIKSKGGVIVQNERYADNKKESAVRMKTGRRLNLPVIVF